MLKRHCLCVLTSLGLLMGTGAAALAAGTPKIQIATSVGVIEAELYADKAPKTVANFVQYVKEILLCSPKKGAHGRDIAKEIRCCSLATSSFPRPTQFSRTRVFRKVSLQARG